MTTGLAALLARYRTLSIAALAALVALAWAWLLLGAGTAMAPQFSLAPAGTGGTGMAGMDMAGMGMAEMGGAEMGGVTGPPAPWAPVRYIVLFSMWWTMMVAMMLPSAAPTILLYGRVAAAAPASSRPAVGAFLSGYLVTWGLFSLIATLMQGLLERLQLMDPATMASQSVRLSGALLIAAGAYQLGPLKNACLRHCQSPARFLARHHRPGPLGAFRMGALHGAICIGCCLSLMALLFVGGVMNLAWIALLTLMVAAEKLLPYGRTVSIALGMGMSRRGRGDADRVMGLSGHRKVRAH